MSSISVAELFDKHAGRLSLNWVAGREGGHRQISYSGVNVKTLVTEADDIDTAGSDNKPPAELSPSKSLVGHLNLIHPNQVQVIGYSELEYLNQLREISRVDALRQLMDSEPSCIIVAEGQRMPDMLLARCKDTQTPLFSSALSSDRLSDYLHFHLTNLLGEIVTLHGVYMEVMAIGVLLVGPSGVGKSELALELITRGHRLVADDAPQFSRLAPDIINGICPPALADFLEVRGIGIVNVRELFGDSAIKSNKYLRLIIRLERLEENRLLDIDRLQGSYRARRILDVEVPEITIPVASGRNLGVLVECAARNHILRTNGYNASEEFMKRQQTLIEQAANT
jgi:HPr kinase/phosphorylase